MRADSLIQTISSKVNNRQLCSLSSLEIKRLRQFLSVVDCGSFTLAASACNLSQQGLSKSIATLEQSIGARLFNRDTRGVTLTECGNLLVPTARNILADVQNFQRQFESLTGTNNGRVVVGAGFTSAGYLLPPVVKRIGLKRPQLQVSIIDGIAEELIPKLLVGDLDVAICIMSMRNEDPRLVQKVLLEEPVSIIVGKNHPLSGRGKVTLGETLNYPWVSWGVPKVHPSISALLKQVGLPEPVPKLVTTSIVFALALLDESDYVSSFSEHMVHRELKSGTLVSLEIESEASRPEITTSLCYRKDLILSRSVLLFIQELERYVSGLGRDLE
ncbi:MAG: LysR family transcriptional regulator [Chromatiales bacterium]|nr:LysR family transcriptional regulator [Chromatiales bacterium]